MRFLVVRLAGAILVLVALARPAGAFGGFFVGTKDAPVFVESAQVVLMREGTRTVLILAPTYEGPPEPFALVVPLPAPPVRDGIRAVPRALVDHLAELDAPRLEEAWEEDPCLDAGASRAASRPARVRPSEAHGAKSEPRSLGEDYDLALVSPRDVGDLSSWLRRHGYVVPGALEERLAGYVAPGATFVVLRPVAGKMHDERAGPGRRTRLTPVRIEIDAERLTLPIRPGLLNSPGTLDLVVHTLARYQRYEAVGRENVLALTDVEVVEAAKHRLGSLVTSLSDRALARTPGAALTEYARDALHCDGCALRPLRADELLVLGADALPGATTDRKNQLFGSGFVLTRLHFRLARDHAEDDLVFAPAAAPLRTPSGSFSSRYVVRHPWSDPILCEAPERGVYRGDARALAQTSVGTNLDDADLAALLAADVPELGLRAPRSPVPDAELAPAESPPPAASGAVGCGCRQGAVGVSSAPCVWAFLLLAAGARRVRSFR